MKYQHQNGIQVVCLPVAINEFAIWMCAFRSICTRCVYKLWNCVILLSNAPLQQRNNIYLQLPTCVTSSIMCFLTRWCRSFKPFLFAAQKHITNKERDEVKESLLCISLNSFTHYVRLKSCWVLYPITCSREFSFLFRCFDAQILLLCFRCHRVATVN